ncbi:MATE family efflux transporter [Aliamphritea ceti]|uniref:MATE family efflux transporter n=1 Tax=Aliamphritea ceti TaxID=1524258 RepID=UPI0021C3BE42|nr:MATE family efflux transporter [Aliamphritea ceti]
MKSAKFVQGSTLKHVSVMTISSTIGLLALFAVDLVDMYFLSLLGQEELAAAIGFSGTLLFFLTSVGIGIQIAMGALVSRAEGVSNRDLVSQYCSSVLLFSLIASVMVTLPAWIWLEELLMFLGARDVTLSLALDYSQILLPSTPLLVCGMSAAATLRGLGDARNAMYTTLGAAVVNALLNPLFIFTFGLEIQGAAIASVLSRVALVGIALYVVIRRHHIHCRPDWQQMRRDLSTILPIAVPAVLTNLATPIGGSYVLKTMASFGDSAVAGAAILGRVTPVAFALIFALSGAIGPIIGQNAGADRYDRVRATLLNALLINFVYILLVWLVLYLTGDSIIAAFSATGEAAYLIDFYTTWLVIGFSFNGVLFIANAASNNLNHATQATLFNFAKALFGTIPLVYLLSQWFGAAGVLAGELAGAVVWGTIALAVVMWQIRQLERQHTHISCREPEVSEAMASPFSSSQCQLGCTYVKGKGEK